MLVESATVAAEVGVAILEARRDIVGERALDTATDELLERLASGPTVAIGLAKQAINYGLHATLGQSMAHELASLELSCRTADFKEGLAAFRDRRTPDFHGR